MLQLLGAVVLVVGGVLVGSGAVSVPVWVVVGGAVVGVVLLIGPWVSNVL